MEGLGGGVAQGADSPPLPPKKIGPITGHMSFQQLHDDLVRHSEMSYQALAAVACDVGAAAHRALVGRVERHLLR
jgi:hypothetical protein